MIYICEICGEIFDEEKEGIKFTDLPDDWRCPICNASKEAFNPINTNQNTIKNSDSQPALFSDIDPNISYIQKIASEGKTVVEAAGAKTSLSPWNDILIMGAQLDRKPLESSVPVNTETIIGKNAKKPLALSAPITISHMSYGSLTGETKIANARASKKLGIAVSSGEGGLYEPELENSANFIFEYVPHKYGINDENLQKIQAIEIKIGQSAKSGLGGHLPGAKVTAEIAKMRGFPEGQDITSPSAFAEINTPNDLKNIVDDLRIRTGGIPIGVKIAANDIEKDLDWIKIANPDYITLDGRGGGTGSAPRLWKENSSIPTLYALIRARKYLDENQMSQSLIITGGIRNSADIVKCLALGADAVALGTAVLVAHTAPVEIDNSEKVYNFLNTTIEEIKTMARASGYDDIRKFNITNLRTISGDIAARTNIKHALDA